MHPPIHSNLILNSKFAIIFGVLIFIIGCGTENIIGICAAILLIALGVQVVCHD